MAGPAWPQAAAQEKSRVLKLEFHFVEVFEAADDFVPLGLQVLFL